MGKKKGGGRRGGGKGGGDSGWSDDSFANNSATPKDCSPGLRGGRSQRGGRGGFSSGAFAALEGDNDGNATDPIAEEDEQNNSSHDDVLDAQVHEEQIEVGNADGDAPRGSRSRSTSRHSTRSHFSHHSNDGEQKDESDWQTVGGGTKWNSNTSSGQRSRRNSQSSNKWTNKEDGEDQRSERDTKNDQQDVQISLNNDGKRSRNPSESKSNRDDSEDSSKNAWDSKTNGFGSQRSKAGSEWEKRQRSWKNVEQGDGDKKLDRSSSDEEMAAAAEPWGRRSRNPSESKSVNEDPAKTSSEGRASMKSGEGRSRHNSSTKPNQDKVLQRSERGEDVEQRDFRIPYNNDGRRSRNPSQSKSIHEKSQEPSGWGNQQSGWGYSGQRSRQASESKSAHEDESAKTSGTGASWNNDGQQSHRSSQKSTLRDDQGHNGPSKGSWGRVSVKDGGERSRHNSSSKPDEDEASHRSESDEKIISGGGFGQSGTWGGGHRSRNHIESSTHEEAKTTASWGRASAKSGGGWGESRLKPNSKGDAPGDEVRTTVIWSQQKADVPFNLKYLPEKEQTKSTWANQQKVDVWNTDKQRSRHCSEKENRDEETDKKDTMSNKGGWRHSGGSRDEDEKKSSGWKQPASWGSQRSRNPSENKSTHDEMETATSWGRASEKSGAWTTSGWGNERQRGRHEEHVAFAEIPQLESHPDDRFGVDDDPNAEPFRPTCEHQKTPFANRTTVESLRVERERKDVVVPRARSSSSSTLAPSKNEPDERLPFSPHGSNGRQDASVYSTPCGMNRTHFARDDFMRWKEERDGKVGRKEKMECCLQQEHEEKQDRHEMGTQTGSSVSRMSSASAYWLRAPKLPVTMVNLQNKWAYCSPDKIQTSSMLNKMFQQRSMNNSLNSQDTNGGDARDGPQDTGGWKKVNNSWRLLENSAESVSSKSGKVGRVKAATARRGLRDSPHEIRQRALEACRPKGCLVTSAPSAVTSSRGDSTLERTLETSTPPVVVNSRDRQDPGTIRTHLHGRGAIKKLVAHFNELTASADEAESRRGFKLIRRPLGKSTPDLSHHYERQQHKSPNRFSKDDSFVDHGKDVENHNDNRMPPQPSSPSPATWLVKKRDSWRQEVTSTPKKDAAPPPRFPTSPLPTGETSEEEARGRVRDMASCFDSYLRKKRSSSAHQNRRPFDIDSHEPSVERNNNNNENQSRYRSRSQSKRRHDWTEEDEEEVMRSRGLLERRIDPENERFGLRPMLRDNARERRTTTNSDMAATEKQISEKHSQLSNETGTTHKIDRYFDFTNHEVCCSGLSTCMLQDLHSGVPFSRQSSRAQLDRVDERTTEMRRGTESSRREDCGNPNSTRVSEVPAEHLAVSLASYRDQLRQKRLAQRGTPSASSSGGAFFQSSSPTTRYSPATTLAPPPHGLPIASYGPSAPSRRTTLDSRTLAVAGMSEHASRRHLVAMATSTPVDSPDGTTKSRRMRSHERERDRDTSEDSSFCSSITTQTAKIHREAWDYQRTLQRIKENIQSQEDHLSSTLHALATNRRKGNTLQELTASRSVLLAEERLDALRQEAQRVQTLLAVRRPPPPLSRQMKGNMQISDITIFLNRNYCNRQEESLTDEPFAFVVLLRCGVEVEATQAVCLHDSRQLRVRTVHFTETVRFCNLPPDFTIRIDIYAMRIQISKSGGKCATSLKSKALNLLSPTSRKVQPSPLAAGPLHHGFVKVGSLLLNRDTCGSQRFYLDDVEYPLEGTIELRSRCTQLPSAVEIEHRGFLTMYQLIGGSASWTRYWAVLRRGHVQFWKYPDDESRQCPPVASMDLTQCVSKKIEAASMDTSQRPFTFAVDLVISTTPSRVDRTRVLLSADNKELCGLWMDALNETLSVIRAPPLIS